MCLVWDLVLPCSFPITGVGAEVLALVPFLKITFEHTRAHKIERTWFQNKDSSTIMMGVECHPCPAPLPSNTEPPERVQSHLPLSPNTLPKERRDQAPGGAPGSLLPCPRCSTHSLEEWEPGPIHVLETNLPHQRKNGGEPHELHLPTFWTPAQACVQSLCQWTHSGHSSHLLSLSLLLCEMGGDEDTFLREWTQMNKSRTMSYCSTFGLLATVRGGINSFGWGLPWGPSG